MLFQNFFWDKVRIDKADVDHHAALPDVVAYKAIVKDGFRVAPRAPVGQVFKPVFVPDVRIEVDVPKFEFHPAP